MGRTLTKHDVEKRWNADGEKILHYVREFARCVAGPGNSLCPEFESVASLEFVRAAMDYDPGRGASFKTYCTRRVINACKRYLLKNDFAVDATVYEETTADPRADGDPRNCTWLEDFTADLSDEARYIAEMLISSPAEVLGLVGGETPRQVRGIIRRHLLEDLGWTHPQAWAGMNALKAALRGTATA